MLDKPGNSCYTIITKGKEKEIKKMAYTIYYYRNDTANTFETNDFRTACIVAFNEVCYLGCEVAHITSNETGEILRTYTKD